MKNDTHYLQVPVRRLVTSGLRKDREDSFIDCVIGLEALLSTESERTELSYKFRVRGSVILSKRRQERKELIAMLKRLYDLRSRLVHGGRVSPNDLETSLPLAEYALRKVWRWFFDHWSNEKSNEKGVVRIDEDLCIR
ncbi:MAG: hypothetical protein H0V35_11275 [Nitrospira sp.]|nr:hypothetical protein [Nitrospira sp.]MBA3753773.1 hypothetical protein [Nitrospira sp.]